MALALVTLAMIVASCTTGTEPLSPLPDGPVELRIRALTPTQLRGIAGERIDPPPTVLIVDASERPVKGVTVQFVSFGSTPLYRHVMTDSTGRAQLREWYAGTAVGTESVVARVGSDSIRFTLDVGPAALHFLKVVQGNWQSGVAGAGMPLPLQIRAADRFNNPIPGVAVSFSVVAGGGSIPGSPVLTDPLGLATSGIWVAGTEGIQRAAASVEDLSVGFAAEACSQAACQWLYFIRDGDIHVRDLMADETRRLTTGAGASQLAISRDGARLAFLTAEGVSVSNSDGTGVRLVASGYRSPSWSPDGRFLALEKCASGEICDIHLVDLVTGGEPQLVTRRGRSPDWAPSGKSIAFVGHYSGPPHAIETVKPDGTERRSLVESWLEPLASPVWAPDGGAVAYSKGGNISVWRDGSERRLTTNGGNSAPRWSPFGLRLLYGRAARSGETVSGEVLFVTADGSESGTVVDDGTSPAWGQLPGRTFAAVPVPVPTTDVQLFFGVHGWIPREVELRAGETVTWTSGLSSWSNSPVTVLWLHDPIIGWYDVDFRSGSLSLTLNVPGTVQYCAGACWDPPDFGVIHVGAPASTRPDR